MSLKEFLSPSGEDDVVQQVDDSNSVDEIIGDVTDSQTVNDDDGEEGQVLSSVGKQLEIVSMAKIILQAVQPDEKSSLGRLQYALRHQKNCRCCLVKPLSSLEFLIAFEVLLRNTI